MYQVVSHFRLRYIYTDYSISLFIIKIKREIKERRKKKVDCSELRPGAPPAGFRVGRPVHPDQTSGGSLPTPVLDHPEKPGRRSTRAEAGEK
jgi:hypothetical protein